MTRLPHLAQLALLALVLGSCAATTPPPGAAAAQRPVSAVRAALPPGYRLFYDALEDYGDWVLIEPYGYLFRPRVDFPSWRPYQDGFWAYTDNFGWVWISSEPFGWATYHYGQWFYDDYQGWVWKPGLDWGPAWVTWGMNDDYAAWSPLINSQRSLDNREVPGGAFVYAPLDHLGQTDLKSVIRTQPEVGDAALTITPVVNRVSRDGVLFNFGPPIGKVERLTGRAFPRVRVEDSLTRRDITAPGASPLVEQTRRAAEDAARGARELAEQKAHTPARLPIVRPLGLPGTPAKPAAPPPAKTPAAPRDTTRR